MKQPVPSRRSFLKMAGASAVTAMCRQHTALADQTKSRPNIVLVMTDDQGWGQMGYYNHPVLKTPNLDAMAANGLRFDRFYAGSASCSPTRASVLTGRSNDRTGVLNHGYPLRIQEKTLPQAMQKAGYATGHFGKWHLNGFSGGGVPVLKSDPRGPGVFGFDEWLSVTNYFEVDPLMSRNGQFEQFKGDSSEVIVAEALKFIRSQAELKEPSFTVIWYGSPHKPFSASDEDKTDFQDLDIDSQNHYGELVAMDRSIGTLREGLRDLEVADNTLVWFNSDNGGLPKITPETVGGLRDFKGSIFEGGFRVPGIVEWPAVITRPRITQHPTVTMDIFPTLAEIVGLPESAMLEPCDGTSIRTLFDEEIGPRNKPIGFRRLGRGALIDNEFKLVTLNVKRDRFLLYNLAEDPGETTNIFDKQPRIAKRMVKVFKAWNESVEASFEGHDYPKPFDPKSNPKHGKWSATEQYKPFVKEFQELRDRIKEPAVQ